jgi:UDP:flavonoid glycosyltransferase YjiC (YdhE family)
VQVTGYCFLEGKLGWHPPADLVDFLQFGPPPVCVGFGSVANVNPAATTEVVVKALTRTGQRGVLLTGWGGLSPANLPDEVFGIEAIPHE